MKTTKITFKQGMCGLEIIAIQRRIFGKSIFTEVPKYRLSFLFMKDFI